MPPNDVPADGKRHLFVKPSKGQATANEIHVTVDGAGELQSKVCYCTCHTSHALLTLGQKRGVPHSQPSPLVRGISYYRLTLRPGVKLVEVAGRFTLLHHAARGCGGGHSRNKSPSP